MLKEETLGYNPTITNFPNLLKPKNRETMLFYEALKRIHKGNSRTLVEEIRRETVILDSLKDDNLKPEEQSAKYKAQDLKISKLKRKLPCLCFSGEFKTRSKKALIKHSGLMILDFDKMTPEALTETIQGLKQNKHVISVFTSPSGNGIKAIVRVPNNLDAITHPKYWEAFVDEFKYDNIDSSGIDLARACFESYDPNIYINSKAEVYNTSLKTTKEVTPKKEVSPKKKNKNVVVKTSPNAIMEFVYNMDRKTSFVDGQKDAHIYSLASHMCEYGVEQQKAENSIMTQVVQGRCKDEPAKLQAIRNAYKNREFGKYEFTDHNRNKRYDSYLKRNGTKEQIAKAEDVDVEVVKEVLKSMDVFWFEEVVKGIPKTKITKYKFGEFLNRYGFWKHYPPESLKAVFVKVDKNIVSETSVSKISDFVIEFVHKDKNLLEAYMNNPYLSSDKFLSLTLETLELKTLRDTAKESFIPYKNGVLEVTRDTIDLVPYDEINCYIWKSQILDRDFEYHKNNNNDYKKFVCNISNQKPEGLESVLGYLISTYKSKTNNKAIILNDEVISEAPEGGTGKGLLMQGIEYIRKTCILDGKSFDETKSFAYQTVNQDTQVLIFDDVKKNFNLESKFSIITEGITLEKKNVTAIKLSVEESPKIVISTNYVIQGDGNSHHRRVHEVEISQYYGKHLAPFDEFKRNLFEDWKREDFEKFDSYMIACLQSFMNDGLQELAPKNLRLRKLIGATNKDFVEWMEDGEHFSYDKKNVKAYVFQMFQSENQDFNKVYFTRRTFNIWVKKYAEYKNLIYTDGSSGGNRWFMLQDKPEKKAINRDIPKIEF